MSEGFQFKEWLARDRTSITISAILLRYIKIRYFQLILRVIYDITKDVFWLVFLCARLTAYIKGGEGAGESLALLDPTIRGKGQSDTKLRIYPCIESGAIISKASLFCSLAARVINFPPPHD